MLALTENAADVIRSLVDVDEAEPPAEIGLRITTESVDDAGAELAITVVDRPAAGDDVVSEHGANVYLSSDASQLLDDKVLDAETHQNHVHFTIAEREGT